MDIVTAPMLAALPWLMHGFSTRAGGASCNPATGTAGVAPCVYFNPFGTSLTGAGTRNTPELFDYIMGSEHFDAHSEPPERNGTPRRRASCATT